MGYGGKITQIRLDENDNTEALEIVDLIAEADDRPGRQVADRLIIQAGKARAERIKERKLGKAPKE